MHLRPSLLPALGVFAAAARHQNFAHAAEELHLTASAVSHHVRKLEGLLGAALFQRHARGVTLTPEGRQLADAAATALADIDSVASAMKPARGTTLLRVSTLHSLAYCWLLPRLPRFCALHPHVSFGFDTSTALARFDDSGPDLAIRHGTGVWPGLTAHHLMDDALFPVASPALAGVKQATGLQDIAKLPLISDIGLQGWRDWFREAGLRGAYPSATHTFSDSTDVMRAAAHGLGAALARKHIATPYLQRNELIQLPGPIIRARSSYYAVHASHRIPSPAARAFIQWLKEEAKSEPSLMPATSNSLLGHTPRPPTKRPQRRR